MSVGLDIGTRTIKVIELEGEGNFTLRASGVVAYSGDSIENLSDDQSTAAFAEIIMKLFKAAGVRSRDIAISLPESLVFTRTVSLPALTNQEVAAAIKWEAEQYIPIPVKEAIIQHQIMERDEGPMGGVRVLLVAAPRTLVEKYIKVVNAARLNVVAVETELLSLARSTAPKNQTALLVDFGARSVDIAIAKNSQLVFSRSIPSAGEALTRALAQGLKISLKEAEEYKRTYGLSSNQLEGRVRQALASIIAGVIDEIKKSIHFYQSEEKGLAPTSTVISGGGAGMPELISYLSNALGTEVLIANPFSGVRVPENVVQTLAPYAPLYSIAVGLAMR